MLEVSKDEFYGSVGQQNVHPHIVSDQYPYKTEWRLPSGRVIGKIVPEDGVYPKGTYPFHTDHYFVAEEMIPLIEQMKRASLTMGDNPINPDEL